MVAALIGGQNKSAATIEWIETLLLSVMQNWKLRLRPQKYTRHKEKKKTQNFARRAAFYHYRRKGLDDKSVFCACETACRGHASEQAQKTSIADLRKSVGLLVSHSGLNPGQEVLDVGVESGLTRSRATNTPANCAPQYIAAGGSVLANERPATVAFAGVLLTAF